MDQSRDREVMIQEHGNGTLITALGVQIMNKKHAATLLGAGVIFAVGVLAWPGVSLAKEVGSLYLLDI